MKYSDPIAFCLAEGYSKGGGELRGRIEADERRVDRRPGMAGFGCGYREWR
jgi:hypothetical protein